MTTERAPSPSAAELDAEATAAELHYAGMLAALRVMADAVAPSSSRQFSRVEQQLGKAALNL